MITGEEITGEIPTGAVPQGAGETERGVGESAERGGRGRTKTQGRGEEDPGGDGNGPFSSTSQRARCSDRSDRSGTTDLCVSGKRQCSGCNQALGKGTAMNIDTLGLYFHLTCFKCGVCKVQLGDTSSGTDVRIRNGLLSCHDCYATSHAVGQPTTL
ncbi:LIM and calponin homology domains-containing protein 1-like [Oncorhynchus keta]|uniref:LIM and calponin homology domains-containing protein 1-like n=1 Tax=Oncorhynchus keta TaxID=8018 RepID=UPI00227C1B54|nr:LIM and calponin homology domains-containing protein 1-like [Oncorhynchus keta]